MATNRNNARSLRGWIIGVLSVLLVLCIVVGVILIFIYRGKVSTDAVYATQQAVVAASVHDQLTAIARNNPTATLVPPTKAPTATLPATATTAPTKVSVPATATQMPAATQAPTTAPKAVAPAAASTFTYDGLPACNNPDQSKPLNGDGGAVLNAKGMWEFKLSNNGCNLVFEGLLVKGERTHHVVVLRGPEGVNTTLVKDGVFTFSEGSIWQKMRDKNMQDLSNMQDPPEAMKLVNDHRANMKANHYDWPIEVHFIDGTSQTFAPGETWSGMPVVNNCGFTEPEKIPVHGDKLAGSNQFAAAIGAEKCTTVAWIDGKLTQWTGQHDAATKVVFTTIDAWLMPFDWTQVQIDEWIAKQPK